MFVLIYISSIAVVLYFPFINVTLFRFLIISGTTVVVYVAMCR